LTLSPGLDRVAGAIVSEEIWISPFAYCTTVPLSGVPRRVVTSLILVSVQAPISVGSEQPERKTPQERLLRMRCHTRSSAALISPQAFSLSTLPAR
jgi:hypothetical protein